jgi:hypothetical protein
MAASPEQKKSYQVSKDFKGIDTKSNRTAITETEFSWLENVQPVGFGNLRVIPNYSRVYDSGNVAVSWTHTPTFLASCNIGLNDYVVAFEDDGSAEYYNIQTQTKGTIASSGTFSNTGVSITQWKNERMLILDPDKGYSSWDGNSVVSIGSVGVIGITNPGSGYTSAPTVTISAPDQINGIQANAVSTITANAVTSISLSNAGTGYTNAANLSVTISGGGGTNATAIAQLLNFNTGTLNLAVQNGGSGYTNAANIVITITGGGGTGAAATAITQGNAIVEVIMTNLGTGYTNAANTVVTVTGGGGSGAVLTPIVNSTKNVSIATFSGRVWIAQGRTVFYSAAGSYSDFTSVSAGSVTLTDSTLHGNIQYLLSANNFLYIFGDDSINVFSDVIVQTNGTTVFTNTNVSASVGSKRPDAIFPYFRSVLFMNDYGVYALVGSTTSKISDQLDGIIPNIDFASPIYAGQVLLNNILCAAFNFRYYDGVFTNSYRYIQAVFFEKKWFITSQGNSLAYITSVPVGGKITLFGTSGRELYQLYANSTSNVTSIVQTALLPMGDPIRTKQALKVGIEATASNATPFVMNVTVDNENRSSPVYFLSSYVTWTNNYNNTIGWTNNALTTVPWGSVGYNLYKTDAQQYGKYLGMTVQSTSPGYIINGFEYEHELRVRF